MNLSISFLWTHSQCLLVTSRPVAVCSRDWSFSLSVLSAVMKKRMTVAQKVTMTSHPLFSCLLCLRWDGLLVPEGHLCASWTSTTSITGEPLGEPVILVAKSQLKNEECDWPTKDKFVVIVILIFLPLPFLQMKILADLTGQVFPPAKGSRHCTCVLLGRTH